MNLAKNKRSIVTFLLGILVGVAIFLIIYSAKIDSLYNERNAYYYANNKKYEEIKRLEYQITHKSSKKPSDEKVNKILIEVVTDNSSIVEDLKIEIEKLLKPFNNRSMQWLSNNPDIVDVYLSKKNIEIKNKASLEINVKYLMFNKTTMKVWINAIELKDRSDNATS